MDDGPLSTTGAGMSPHLRRALHWAGSALALAGVIFVGLRLETYWADIDTSHIEPAIYKAVGIDDAGIQPGKFAAD